jgi:hypothetical protein
MLNASRTVAKVAHPLGDNAGDNWGRADAFYRVSKELWREYQLYNK